MADEATVGFTLQKNTCAMGLFAPFKTMLNKCGQCKNSVGHRWTIGYGSYHEKGHDIVDLIRSNLGHI